MAGDETGGVIPRMGGGNDGRAGGTVVAGVVLAAGGADGAPCGIAWNGTVGGS